MTSRIRNPTVPAVPGSSRRNSVGPSERPTSRANCQPRATSTTVVAICTGVSTRRRARRGRRRRPGPRPAAAAGRTPGCARASPRGRSAAARGRPRATSGSGVEELLHDWWRGCDDRLAQGHHHPAGRYRDVRCDGWSQCRVARGAPLRTASSVPPPAPGGLRRRWRRPRGQRVPRRTSRHGPAGRRRPSAPARGAPAPRGAPARPGRVGAARVELLVALDEVRPVGPQPLHEDRRAPRRAGAARCRRRRSRRPPPPARRISSTWSRVVVDPGHQRRDEDAGRDARPG